MIVRLTRTSLKIAVILTNVRIGTEDVNIHAWIHRILTTASVAPGTDYKMDTA